MMIWMLLVAKCLVVSTQITVCEDLRCFTLAAIWHRLSFGLRADRRMEIAFETKHLRDLCESDRLLKQRFGESMGSTVKTRLADFRAAKSLSDIILLWDFDTIDTPIAGALELRETGLRMVIIPNQKTVARSDAGEILWENLVRIKFLAIEQINAANS
jgi:hypothetical protein